jgi:hypothetical protein
MATICGSKIVSLIYWGVRHVRTFIVQGKPALFRARNFSGLETYRELLEHVLSVVAFAVAFREMR